MWQAQSETSVCHVRPRLAQSRQAPEFARSRIQTEQARRSRRHAQALGRPGRRRGARAVSPVAEAPLATRARALARAPRGRAALPPPAARGPRRRARHAGVSRAAAETRVSSFSRADGTETKSRLATPTTRPIETGGLRPRVTPALGARDTDEREPRFAGFSFAFVFVFRREKGALLRLARLFSARVSSRRGARASIAQHRSRRPGGRRHQRFGELVRPRLAGDGGQVLVQAGVRVSGAGASTVSQHLRPRLLKRHAEPLALRRGVRRGDARARRASSARPSATRRAAATPSARRRRRARARRRSSSQCASRSSSAARTRRARGASPPPRRRARPRPRARRPAASRRPKKPTVASTARSRVATASALAATRGGAATTAAARRSRVARQRHDAIAATAVVRSNARCLPTVANARARAHAATRPRAASTAGTRRRRCAFIAARARAKPSTRDRSSRRLRPRRVGAPSRRARRAASPPNRRSPTGPTRGGVVRASAASPRRAPVPCRRRVLASRGKPRRGGSPIRGRRAAENCQHASLGRSRDASSFGSRSRQNQK